MTAYRVVEDDALERLAQAVDEAQASVDAQPVGPARRAAALREAVEAFQREGLKRVLQVIVEHPDADQMVARLGQDPFVQALLEAHGLVRPGIESRILDGLVDARPWLREHGGDVEFVERVGDVVRLRLTGSCSECTLAELTLHEMVFNAIKRKAPEIARVELVEDQPRETLPQREVIEHPGPGWEPGPALEDLPESSTFRFDTRESSVLVHKRGDDIRAWLNRCPHRGFALDGALHDGCGDSESDCGPAALTCPWHGWRFDLDSGDCTEIGDARLTPVPVIVRGGTVWLRP